MTENKAKKKREKNNVRKVKKRRIIEWNSKEKKIGNIDIGVFQTTISSSLLGWSGFH